MSKEFENVCAIMMRENGVLIVYCCGVTITELRSMYERALYLGDEILVAIDQTELCDLSLVKDGTRLRNWYALPSEKFQDAYDSLIKRMM